MLAKHVPFNIGDQKALVYGMYRAPFKGSIGVPLKGSIRFLLREMHLSYHNRDL